MVHLISTPKNIVLHYLTITNLLRCNVSTLSFQDNNNIQYRNLTKRMKKCVVFLQHISSLSTVWCRGHFNKSLIPLFHIWKWKVIFMIDVWGPLFVQIKWNKVCSWMHKHRTLFRLPYKRLVQQTISPDFALKKYLSTYQNLNLRFRFSKQSQNRSQWSHLRYPHRLYPSVTVIWTNCCCLCTCALCIPKCSTLDWRLQTNTNV